MADASMSDLTHSEISSRGGKSKSTAKISAVRRNLAKAKAVLSAKRANAKELLSAGGAGRLRAQTS